MQVHFTHLRPFITDFRDWEESAEIMRDFLFLLLSTSGEEKESGLGGMHLLSAIAHLETQLPYLLWNHECTILQVNGSPLIIGAIQHTASLLLCQA
jgi:hypothetical protein